MHDIFESAASLPSTSTASAATAAAVAGEQYRQQQAHPDLAHLSRAKHQELLWTLKHIPDKVNELQKKAIIDEETYGTDAKTAAERGGLFLRQLRMEEETHSDAVNAYTQSLKQLIGMGKGTNLRYIQRILLKWYEPLAREIDAEIRRIEKKEVGMDRTIYGPPLLLLPPEKLAVITLEESLNTILKSGNSGVTLTYLARRIGDLVEAEVSIINLQKGKAGLRPWQKDMIRNAYQEPNFRKTRAMLNKLVDDDNWSNEVKVKVGASLILFLLETARTEKNLPAFLHSKQFVANKSYKRVGIIRLEQAQYQEIAQKDLKYVIPRYLPMLVPPKRWDNKKTRDGCYFRLKSAIVRSTSRAQMDAVRRANIGPVLEGLDFLGQVPWKINVPMLRIVKEAWNRRLQVMCPRMPPPWCHARYAAITASSYAAIMGPRRGHWTANAPCTQAAPWCPLTRPCPIAVQVGDLPSTDVPLPRKEDCYRVIKPKPKYDPVTQTAIPEEPVDPSLPPPEPEFDERYYNEMVRRVNTKNSEVHSLRCDLQLKLWVADKFIDDTFYYPYNMDFRGRAYPVPPNLNHLGSDLCRGILTFADVKPLGPDGLMWMKVHLANLFGNNKIPHTERVQWVDDNMDKVRECAANPLDGSRWWCDADEPFQALSTCRELVAAIDSGDPAAFVSGMPVHQDGSCNGLQHYAALGRDEAGATAVNVKPSVRPQDVYTGVLNIVLKKIDADMAIAEDEADEAVQKRGKFARLVHGVVNRKVIKQTVMTSVYGVTRIGARAQVQARLEEKMMSEPGTVITPEKEKELFEASRYVANLTLDSLSEMFSSAKEIMDWLGDSAALVASQGQMMAWVTPLGLPVCQPYRKSGTHTVRTILQNITLSVDDDSLPVSKQKQRSAFPPNFVHSLDASHMLMTALKMKQQNVTFAAVHDSYWTHAADIPAMNRAVRECFVELYEQPILESLHDSLTMRYPDIKFPPVPPRGNLDIKSVHDSAYFFH